MKTYRRFLISVLFFLFFSAGPLSADANDLFNRVMLGVRSGYSQVAGTYADEIDGTAMIGVSVIPLGYRFVFIEADFIYASYSLAESSDSMLSSMTFGAGPLFIYSPFSFVEFYAGISFIYSYLHLRAATLGREERALNPGFALKAGAHFPVGWGLGVRAGVDYQHNYLSGKPFLNINYCAGVTYNFSYIFSPAEKGQDDPARIEGRIDDLYRKGAAHLDNGEVQKAKANFAEVLSLKPNHKGAKKMNDLIGTKEETFRNAGELLEQKQYYKAIPMLEDAGSHLPEARSLLADVRTRLSAEVPSLEKEGIKAYEMKEYEKCIAVMQRIKLINPANNVVQIYLPRAKRRFEALQKLK